MACWYCCRISGTYYLRYFFLWFIRRLRFFSIEETWLLILKFFISKPYELLSAYSTNVAALPLNLILIKLKMSSSHSVQHSNCYLQFLCDWMLRINNCFVLSVYCAITSEAWIMPRAALSTKSNYWFHSYLFEKQNYWNFKLEIKNLIFWNWKLISKSF